jgi:hypothetical protein
LCWRFWQAWEFQKLVWCFLSIYYYAQGTTQWQQRNGDRAARSLCKRPSQTSCHLSPCLGPTLKMFIRRYSVPSLKSRDTNMSIIRTHTKVSGKDLPSRENEAFPTLTRSTSSPHKLHPTAFAPLTLHIADKLAQHRWPTRG